MEHTAEKRASRNLHNMRTVKAIRQLPDSKPNWKNTSYLLYPLIQSMNNGSQLVKQPNNNKTAQITDTVITLETVSDSLPPGTISDYSAKQRLLDTMDIKLKRDVKPHIISDTSFNQLVEITEKIYAIAHSTGLYGNRNQHSHASSNAVIPLKPRNARNNHQVPSQRYSNNTSQHTYLSPQEKERRKRAGTCYYCGKKGDYSNDCYLKKKNQNQN